MPNFKIQKVSQIFYYDIYIGRGYFRLIVRAAYQYWSHYNLGEQNKVCQNIKKHPLDDLVLRFLNIKIT